MPYIELGRGLRTLVDPDIFEAVGHLRWYAAKNGRSHHVYARCATRDPITGRRMLLHHVVARSGGVAGQGPHVHHKDGNTLTNLRRNVMWATAHENARARRRSPDRPHLTPYHGVTRDRKGRAVAQITADGRSYRIGTFECDVEAAIARDRVGRQLFGDFAILNFPHDDGRPLLTRVDPARGGGKRVAPPFDMAAVVAGTRTP